MQTLEEKIETPWSVLASAVRMIHHVTGMEEGAILSILQPTIICDNLLKHLVEHDLKKNPDPTDELDVLVKRWTNELNSGSKVLNECVDELKSIIANTPAYPLHAQVYPLEKLTLLVDYWRDNAMTSTKQDADVLRSCATQLNSINWKNSKS